MEKESGLMEVLWTIILEIAAFILEALIPSKKRKKYRKNVKVLKKQDWFRRLAKDYGPTFYMTQSIRAKILQYNDSLDLQIYRQELERTARRAIG
ncbi:hypothetical protein [Terribacillus saccharophilus]|nr:hypothetical protein [Terribacillus goriensis]MEC0284009.1 hypothetical protein [Terribacillus saccharophilus]MEC0289902.1 hypothetical protein [Terribacillus saccharophilus]